MASSRVNTTSLIDSRTNWVLSTGKSIAKPGGSDAASSLARFLTASAVCKALAPGASLTAMPAAAWPLNLAWTL